MMTATGLPWVLAMRLRLLFYGGDLATFRGRLERPPTRCANGSGGSAG
jgi:hypothetical protein